MIKTRITNTDIIIYSHLTQKQKDSVKWLTKTYNKLLEHKNDHRTTSGWICDNDIYIEEYKQGLSAAIKLGVKLERKRLSDEKKAAVIEEKRLAKLERERLSAEKKAAAAAEKELERAAKLQAKADTIHWFDTETTTAKQLGRFSKKFLGDYTATLYHYNNQNVDPQLYRLDGNKITHYPVSADARNQQLRSLLTNNLDVFYEESGQEELKTKHESMIFTSFIAGRGANYGRAFTEAQLSNNKPVYVNNAGFGGVDEEGQPFYASKPLHEISPGRAKRSDTPNWNMFLDRLNCPQTFMAFIYGVASNEYTGRQAIWLQGDGNEGKTFITSFLASELLPNARASIGDDFFQGDKSRFSIARMIGARLVLIDDVAVTSILENTVFKTVCSGESTQTVNVENKGKDSSEGIVEAKFILTSNKRPRVYDMQSTISRLLPLKIEPRTDKGCKDTWTRELTRELPAFLNRCQQAYKAACPGNNVITSPIVDEYLKELKAASEAPLYSQVHGLLNHNRASSIKMEEFFNECSRNNQTEGKKMLMKKMMTQIGYDIVLYKGVEYINHACWGNDARIGTTATHNAIPEEQARPMVHSDAEKYFQRHTATGSMDDLKKAFATA